MAFVNVIVTMALFVSSTLASQVVLGHAADMTMTSQRLDSESRDSIDEFIVAESLTARRELFCNIGPDGCHAQEVKAGLVIASTDKYNPPYFYTWTRDSALVFKCLVEMFVQEYDASLQERIQNYIVAQAKIQGISNPSGSLADGTGLGEPKFNVDMTAFHENWGRPQRDGPALRAITLLAYARWLVENDYHSTVSHVIWPILRNDLSYVAHYWNVTGFDLWEEVRGSSFFTIASQYRALIEGKALAELLNLGGGEPFGDVAPQLLCFLQSFWTSHEHYMHANIHTRTRRTGKDANTILASIHLFDPALGCDSITFQPCSDRALANHRAVTDSFRSVYAINRGLPRGIAVAVGRYAEDKYYRGNPWYLTTLAAAEQLYDALCVWEQQRYIDITPTSLLFFRDLVGEVDVGRFPSNCSTYDDLREAVSKYADGFIGVVAANTGPRGSLSEQFGRRNGKPLSAHDLTWSYTAFLTAANRRAGILPPPWSPATQHAMPSKCVAKSVVGQYASATQTNFPCVQTPKSGNGGATSAPPAPTCTATIVPTPTPPRCAGVAVRFNVMATTEWGETIKVVGNTKALGRWSLAQAVPLDSSHYTATHPQWMQSITLSPGKKVEYKYIRVGQDGFVEWDSGANRVYKVPTSRDSCHDTITDRWRADSLN